MAKDKVFKRKAKRSQTDMTCDIVLKVTVPNTLEEITDAIYQLEAEYHLLLGDLKNAGDDRRRTSLPYARDEF